MRKKLDRAPLEPQKEQELRKYSYIALFIFIVFVLLQFFMPAIKNLYLPQQKTQKISSVQDKAQRNSEGLPKTTNSTLSPFDNNPTEKEPDHTVEKTSTLDEVALNQVFTEITKDKNLSTLKQGDSYITVTQSNVTLFMTAGAKESITVTMELNEQKNLLQTASFDFKNFPDTFRDELKEQLADNLTASTNQYIMQKLQTSKIASITLKNKSMDIVYF